MLLNVNKCFLLSRLAWTKWPQDTCWPTWSPLLVRKWLLFNNPASEGRERNMSFCKRVFSASSCRYTGHSVRRSRPLTWCRSRVLWRGEFSLFTHLLVRFSSCSLFCRWLIISVQCPNNPNKYFMTQTTKWVCVCFTVTFDFFGHFKPSFFLKTLHFLSKKNKKKLKY